MAALKESVELIPDPILYEVKHPKVFVNGKHIKKGSQLEPSQKDIEKLGDKIFKVQVKPKVKLG